MQYYCQLAVVTLFIDVSCDKLYLPSVLMTLLVGRQEGHPAHKKLGGGVAGASCRLAYSPADATATHCLLLQ